VRAATVAKAVLAEEAVLMAEVLADGRQMQTTADNKQQSTINNRLGAKPCLAVSTTEVLWQ
jgi:hypothetical protein